MATRLTKPVVRMLEVPLRATGFRTGFVARLTEEGVYLKPPGARWTSAMLATWGDIAVAGATRKAQERERARAERRRLRRLGAS